MTNEELLIPRFKVMLDYPNSNYKVGLVITTDFTDYYPHIFKPMKWWEEREQKAMPMFLKNSVEDDVQEVDKVGDALLAKDLDDWCKVGENWFGTDKYIWEQLDFNIFKGNRTIETIDLKDGVKAFLVSGTIDVWIRAKGFRKFCESKKLSMKELELKELELKEAKEILSHFESWKNGDVDFFIYSGNQLTEAINLIVEENKK